MPWQQQVADVALELDPTTGLYAYSTVIVTVQRQAGKTTLVLSVGTHRCLVNPRARVWYSAQKGKDADEWMREEAFAYLDSSLFKGRYKKRKSQGSTGLTWANGSTFRAFAPVRDGLHGKQSDLVFPDEAWAHDEQRGDELKQAIRPTMATRPGAQVWPMSTAGDIDSVYLAQYVELGRASVAAGRRSGVAFFDWGIPDDVDPEDIEAVARFHPAVGFTIDKQALYDARDELKPGEFARAYGNRWTGTAERIIPAESWTSCAVTGTWPEPAVPVALGFETGVSGNDASITAAWRPHPDAPIFVDVIEHGPGTAWVARRIKELSDDRRPVAVGYNARGAAVDVADQVERAGVKLLAVNTSDYVAACKGLLADIIEAPAPGQPRRLQHPSHPSLDQAVDLAAQRNVGDGWAWAPRKSAGSITTLASATVARWAFDHAPVRQRPVVIVRRR